jgi:hypothetical protein
VLCPYHRQSQRPRQPNAAIARSMRFFRMRLKKSTAHRQECLCYLRQKLERGEEGGEEGGAVGECADEDVFAGGVGGVAYGA